MYQDLGTIQEEMKSYSREYAAQLMETPIAEVGQLITVTKQLQSLQGGSGTVPISSLAMLSMLT